MSARPCGIVPDCKRISLPEIPERMRKGVPVTGDSPTPGQEPRPKIDTSVANPARVWDYWLSGKDNYPSDREVGDQLNATMPEVVIWARADREFLSRAVRYLVTEAGIRQFLDIGTGIPTANNTHEVAQSIAPE